MNEQQPQQLQIAFSMNGQETGTIFELAMRAPMLEAERLWLYGKFNEWQRAVEAATKAQQAKAGPGNVAPPAA